MDKQDIKNLYVKQYDENGKLIKSGTIRFRGDDFGEWPFKLFLYFDKLNNGEEPFETRVDKFLSNFYESNKDVSKWISSKPPRVEFISQKQDYIVGSYNKQAFKINKGLKIILTNQKPVNLMLKYYVADEDKKEVIRNRLKNRYTLDNIPENFLKHKWSIKYLQMIREPKYFVDTYYYFENKKFKQKMLDKLQPIMDKYKDINTQLINQLKELSKEELDKYTKLKEEVIKEEMPLELDDLTLE